MYAGVAERWTNGSNFHREPNEIRETDRIEAATVEGDAIRVTWRDGVEHVFPVERLWNQIHNQDATERILPVKWDARTDFQSFDSARVMDNDGELFLLLRSFLERGLAFLHNVPPTEDQIEVVAKRLSTLHRSHLGDTFTLLPMETSQHLGETRDDIPLHIDLVYKQRPPDIQMLHVLDQASAGGENVFVDAFTVIDQMENEDIRLLRATPVWFVAESETVHFRGLHRILVFDEWHGFQGVHYNEYKVVFPVEVPNEFYFAFRRFQQIIRLEKNAKVMRPPAGSIVIFHNLRTLHGRRAFSGNSRHVTGCFLSEDDLKSTYRTMARHQRRLRSI